jgi:putative transposase
LKRLANHFIFDSVTVANVRLTPTTAQAKPLCNTLECRNPGCKPISQRGFDAGAPRQYALQKLVYHQLRQEFGAQAAIRCAADTPQKANGGLVRYRKYAAQPDDNRIFRLAADDSITTLAGRMKVPFVCGERAHALLAYRKGDIDLMLVRGKWSVAIVCDVPDPEKRRPYSGTDVERIRQKFSFRRGGLQCGGKAAKPRLKKLSGTEWRFRKPTHCLSKEIVATAERSRLAIAIEDLTHIRKRVEARRAQRNRLHGLSFAQLRRFVTYEAALRGLPVVAIDPHNTRRACPEYGSIHKANRKTQQTFSCTDCGHTAAADFGGARIIQAFGMRV